MLTTSFARWSDFVHQAGEALSAEGTAGTKPRLVGLLFMKEGNEIAERQIIPSVRYHDMNTGPFLDIFIPGWKFAVFGPAEADQRARAMYFNFEQFRDSRDAVEEATGWSYSGGVELLLFSGTIKPEEFRIDLGGAIALDISFLIGNKLIDSCDHLFERVARFARRYDGVNPIADFSLQEVRVSVADGVVNFLKGLLPKDVRANLDYLGQWIVKDFSNRQRSQRTMLSGIEVLSIHEPDTQYTQQMHVKRRLSDPEDY